MRKWLLIGGTLAFLVAVFAAFLWFQRDVPVAVNRDKPQPASRPAPAATRGPAATGRAASTLQVRAAIRAVALLHARVRKHGATEWTGGWFADGFVVRDGRILEWHTFWARDEALRWALASAFGVRSICWKVMVMTIPAPNLRA